MPQRKGQIIANIIRNSSWKKYKSLYIKSFVNNRVNIAAYLFVAEQRSNDSKYHTKFQFAKSLHTKSSFCTMRLRHMTKHRSISINRGIGMFFFYSIASVTIPLKNTNKICFVLFSRIAWYHIKSLNICQILAQWG